MAEDSSEIVKEAAEGVVFNNVKTIGETAAFYTGMQFANATSHQQGMNALYAGIVTKAVESLLTTQSSEGVVDSALAQILTKVAQTTRPETGGT